MFFLLSLFLFSLVIIPNWDVASDSKLTASSTALAYKHNGIDSYICANISQAHTNIDIIIPHLSRKILGKREFKINAYGEHWRHKLSRETLYE